MNLKHLFIAILILGGNSVFAQDSTAYEWKKVRSYSIDSNEVWSVDNLENVYISHETAINKYDTAGVLKFSQSIKSLGRMTELIPVNSMKLVHFSEDQQTLCYLDNTLTLSHDCIELADKEIINARLISSSYRSDMLWVYDDVNSQLTLMPMIEGQQQRQDILNVKGLLGINQVDQIMEKYGVLNVLDKSKGIYTLDAYGTLLGFEEVENVLCMDRDRSGSDVTYLLTNEELIVKTITNRDQPIEFKYKLPISDIVEFYVIDSSVFFRTSKYVHKFKLELTK